MRMYFEEKDKGPWLARYKLLTLLRKVDTSVEYCICRESNGGSGRWFFDLKLK